MAQAAQRGGERLSEHPAPSILHAFARGELPPAEARAVTVHLLGGCAACRARLAPFAAWLLDTRREEPPAPEPPRAKVEAGYDAALDRALAAVRRSQWQTARERTAAAPPSGPWTRERCLGLLERSRALRHEDPRSMLRLAVAAATVAERVAGERRQTIDLRALAWAELANALRVNDDLAQAERMMRRAEEARRRGTGDEVVLARVLDLTASLRASQRRFDEALALLDRLRGLHAARGDRHGAGRALVKKGIYVGYDGRPAEAIELLRQAYGEIDRQREPGLARSAADGLVHALIDLGRYEEARLLLWQGRPLYAADGNRQNRRKLCWLEGRVHAGLGELDQAEAALSGVRAGFERDRLPYNAALVSLDLGGVLLRRERWAEARLVIADALAAFRALGIRRETMGALASLAECVRSQHEAPAACLALLEGVAAGLRRIDAWR